MDRKRDFTFPTDLKELKEEFPTTGGSEKFINFIEKELQDFIDDHYNTNTTKTIIGQSLGGLLAAEILFKKPKLFTNYIIVSPSLWWDEESLMLVENKLNQPQSSIYIAVGKEGEVMERVAKELSEKLKGKDVNAKNIFFEYFDGSNHANILHLAVYNAFVKIFDAPEDVSK